MKKLFGKSAKSKDIDIEQIEVQTSRKSKRKLLKACGFGGLALMMATAGVFAFAPLGAVQPASLANSVSQPTDVLVTPKEDDPVLFTTEDGLEIKWGNAASLQGGGKETWSGSFTSESAANTNIGDTHPATDNTSNLSSGNLSGFPYFTTTSGSTTYTWVIIGRNSNVTKATYGSMNKTNTASGSKSSAKIEYKTLNDWKAKIGNADTYNNFVAGYSPTYKSFFNNTYETTSPAGAAINNNGLLSAVTARNYSASTSYSYTRYQTVSQVKTNAEIPSGCVLVLANGNVTTGVYNTNYASGGYSHHRHATYASTEQIKTTMEGYYTNSSYGLSVVKSRIQAVTLSTYTYVRNSSGTWGWNTNSAGSQHVFPLGAHSSSTFYWANYLTAAQIKLSANQWVRGHNGTSTSYSYPASVVFFYGSYLNTSGSLAENNVSSTYGYRPAFVLKVT